MKKILTVFVLLLMACFMTGCKKVEGVIEDGKLYVGISPDYAPYEFIDLTKDGDDKYVGSDVELAKKIADELGLELVLKPMNFDLILAGLDSGKIDVAISGFTWSSERADAYLFSSSYYDDGEGDQILVFKASDQDKFQSLDDLNKKEVKVAAQNGSLQQELVEGQLPNATHVFFEDINNAFTALNTGQYDAIAVAGVVAQTLLTSEENKDIVMSSFQFEVESSALYVIMQKDNSVLAEQINPICEEVACGLYEEWLKAADALYQALGDNAAEISPDPEEEEPDSAE